MRRFAYLIVLFALLFSASAVAAQEATPEATSEVEQTLSEIFAGLPQSRTEDGGYVVGEPDAPVTIIEFADFACPHCQDYREVIDQAIVNFVATGQAKFELRIFPTAGGEITYFVGKLVECAEEQSPGAFWQSYELLYDYATSRQYTASVGRRLAADLDLNYSTLRACAEDAMQIDTDMAQAREWGVNGTPAIMVRLGDSEPQFIVYDGVTFDRGGVPYELLDWVVTNPDIEPVTPEAEVI